MFDFLNLLESVTVSRMLREGLSPSEAEAFLRKQGVDVGALTSKQAIGQVRRQLAKKLHPDLHKGGDELIKLANDALDVMAKRLSDTAGYAYTGWNRPARDTGSRDEDHGIPPWQTDPRASSSRINREDFRDMHFFMKKMWEFSGHSRHRWTIHAFDGHFFRSIITVFGSKEIFDQMAQAMVIWNSHGGNPYRTRAVFAQDSAKPSELVLIYLDGHLVRPPVTMEHGSFNNNPDNDRAFVRWLPSMLDDIAAKHGFNSKA